MRSICFLIATRNRKPVIIDCVKSAAYAEETRRNCEDENEEAGCRLHREEQTGTSRDAAWAMLEPFISGG